MLRESAVAFDLVNNSKHSMIRYILKSVNNISLDRKYSTAAKLFKRPLVEVSDESASESNMNEGMDQQQYQTASKHKLKGWKVQKRAMRMRKLASLYKSIGDLLEEEADELIVL